MMSKRRYSQEINWHRLQAAGSVAQLKVLNRTYLNDPAIYKVLRDVEEALRLAMRQSELSLGIATKEKKHETK